MPLLPARHALVVGGTRGIGLAVSRAFLKAGYRVTAIGRRTPEDPLFNHPKIAFWSVDLRDECGLNPALSSLLSNRGVPDVAVFLQRFRGDENAWQSELSISLLASSRIIEWLASHMTPEHDHGVVMVGSLAGRLVAPEQSLVYHLAKASIEQMARFYAVQLGPQRIRVNAVSLGPILKQESQHFYDEHADLKQLYANATPLRRMGTTEEVAEAILFLCGSSASFITGQTLVVDGGLSLLAQDALARNISPLKDLPVTRHTGGSA